MTENLTNKLMFLLNFCNFCAPLKRRKCTNLTISWFDIDVENIIVEHDLMRTLSGNYLEVVLI